MNKKGIFFSIMALLLIGVVAFGAKTTQQQTLVNRNPVVTERVLSANNLLQEIEDNYISRAVTISTYSALEYYARNISLEGNSVTQATLNQSLITLISNGTLEGEDAITNHLENLIIKIKDNTKGHFSMGLDYNYSVQNIWQDETTGPWYVAVRLESNYSLDADTAYWYKQRNRTYLVNIRGMTDPYLGRKTADISRKILQTETEEWDIAALEMFINNTKYLFDNHSPMYLQRFTNDLSDSECCGIRTFITNESMYKNSGILGGFKNQSWVDTCYYEEDCGEYVYKIKNISSDFSEDNYSYPFRIDSYSFAVFELTEESSEDVLID